MDINADHIELYSAIASDIQEAVDSGEVFLTSHLDPQWLPNLIQNYHARVVDKCSKKVKDAVRENKVFVLPAQKSLKKEVRLALIHATLDEVEKCFSINRPRLAEMKQIVSTMGHTYPAMFQSSGKGEGYGLGGSRGQDGLANQMLDMLRNRTGGPRHLKSDIMDTGSKDKTKTVGHRKYIYGMVLIKYFISISSCRC